MSLLVHIPSRRELSGEREANGFRRKEQRGRYGLHRRYQSRDDNQFFRPVVAVLLRKEAEAEAPATHIFDLSKAGNERIRHVAGIDQPAPIAILGIQQFYPLQRGLKLHRACLFASHAPAIRTAPRCNGFGSVNARRPIGGEPAGART